MSIAKFKVGDIVSCYLPAILSTGRSRLNNGIVETIDYDTFGEPVYDVRFYKLGKVRYSYPEHLVNEPIDIKQQCVEFDVFTRKKLD